MRTKAPGQSSLLFLDVARVLTAQNVPYAVVGALAAAVHGEIRATTDADAFARTITVPFQGDTLRMIGREDFIAMKCYAGGPQDIADARAALNSHNTATDLDLLRRLTRRFGRAATDALENLLSL